GRAGRGRSGARGGGVGGGGRDGACRGVGVSVRHVMSQAKDMPVRYVVVAVMLAAGPFVVGAGLTFADGVGDPTAVKHDDGRYYDKEGNPTFKVQSDGTVDWGTYSGFRRYHSDSHVCHGPDAEGSSYAPALSNYLKTKNYVDFANVVVNGRKNVNTAQESVMPSFGTNPNVMCYIGDIFVYLRARANDAVPRGRPQKHEDKPEAATQAENSCLGHKSRALPGPKRSSACRRTHGSTRRDRCRVPPTASGCGRACAFRPRRSRSHSCAENCSRKRWNARIGRSSSSIPRCSGSAPIRITCRSRPSGAKALKTSSPSCWPISSARGFHIAGTRRQRVSCAIRSRRTNATSLWASRRATMWCRSPIRTTARLTPLCSSRGMAWRAWTRSAILASRTNTSASWPGRLPAT